MQGATVFEWEKLGKSSRSIEIAWDHRLLNNTNKGEASGNLWNFKVALKAPCFFQVSR